MSAFSSGNSSNSESKADMGKPPKDDQRLKSILRGAFAGSPTPLKDIPKKGGESRKEKRNEADAKKSKEASRKTD